MEGEPCLAGLSAESANPLLRAVFLRRLRLTRLLLEGGAYINESDGQGQTPLMVACSTQHADAQSVSRTRLVKYLLERGADPNIQDKAGRSALMHACRERAGAEVVSSLLAGGADVGLEDRSGTSALVYAVAAGDQKVLALLLDTCKAQGKEVIIIATDKFPCGRLEPGQYLSMCSLAPADRTASAAPCSPSEIKLITSPQCPSPASTKQVFSFQGGLSCEDSRVTSQPCSPTRGLSQGGPNRLQQPLLRLNSEPWLKIPLSMSAQKPPGGHSAADKLPDLHTKEEVTLEHTRLGTDWGEKVLRDPQWLDVSDNQRRTRANTVMIDGLNKSERRPMGQGRESGVHREGEGKGESGKTLGHKIYLPGLISSHSASHPNLHSQSLAANLLTPSPSFLCSKTPLDLSLLSGLRGIISRRKLGADHYSSDPQLAGQTLGPPENHLQRGQAEGRRMLISRSSTLLSSRESLEAPGLARRVLSGKERRGSGPFLMGDDVCQSRPRCLPPLNVHASSNTAPVLGIGNPSVRDTCGAAGLKTFLPSAPPGHPREVTRKLLLRRHSMQTTA